MSPIHQLSVSNRKYVQFKNTNKYTNTNFGYKYKYMNTGTNTNTNTQAALAIHPSIDVCDPPDVCSVWKYPNNTKSNQYHEKEASFSKYLNMD